MKSPVGLRPWPGCSCLAKLSGEDGDCSPALMGRLGLDPELLRCFPTAWLLGVEVLRVTHVIRRCGPQRVPNPSVLHQRHLLGHPPALPLPSPPPLAPLFPSLAQPPPSLWRSRHHGRPHNEAIVSRSPTEARNMAEA